MDKKSIEYKLAFDSANEKYGSKSSIYRSAYIVKKYKELGGRFIASKPNEEKGLKRWFESEKWIHVIPYLTTGEIVICGSSNKTEPCRPLIRKNNETPVTLPELLEIYSKKDILKIAKKKKQYPEKRLTWKTLNLN
jgi:hypothetical protein